MDEIRRVALECATRVGQGRRPLAVVGLAREFEHYLRHGHMYADAVLVPEKPCAVCARTPVTPDAGKLMQGDPAEWQRARTDQGVPVPVSVLKAELGVGTENPEPCCPHPASDHYLGPNGRGECLHEYPVTPVSSMYCPCTGYRREAAPAVPDALCINCEHAHHVSLCEVRLPSGPGTKRCGCDWGGR